MSEVLQTQNTPEDPRNPFTTAAIALQARAPVWWASMVALSLCLFIFLALLFATFFRMDVVVSAQGRVVSLGKSKVIQPLETGVIKRIAVKDGQAVKAGDVLIELDATIAHADGLRLQQELWESQTDTQRAQALLKGKRKLDVPVDMPVDMAQNEQLLLTNRLLAQRSRLVNLDAEVGRKEAEMQSASSALSHAQEALPLLRKKYEMYKTLAEKGFAAQTNAWDAKLEWINSRKDLAFQKSRLQETKEALRGAVAQRDQAQAEFKVQTGMEWSEARKKMTLAQQELSKAQWREGLQLLKAPVDGVVQQLAVSTIGGVVTPGQPLMTIVPRNDVLEIEAQVANRDIGQIKPGQRVIVKVEAFDFTRYGYIEGQVAWVGTDAVVDQKLGPVYPVRIRIASSQTPKGGHGHKGALTAGMTVTTDIKTDSRRLIEYFIAPLLRASSEGLRER